MACLIDSIEGQNAAWERLRHLHNSDRLPQAMAFTGLPGIGKKRVAWALAQLLLCEREGKGPRDTRACGECGSCRRVEHGQSESVLLLEPQGTQIKIEAAHQVIEFLSLARLASARVVMVNEAQFLNPQAANALLKIVEEPPPRTHFIFVVPEITQLLPTLRSRCQVLRFAPIEEDVLQKRGKAVSEGEIQPWMVRSARGSFERLAEFNDPEMDHLRQRTFAFLLASFSGRREELESLMAEAKERTVALRILHFLQQALRDWVLLGTGKEIHADQMAQLNRLPQLQPAGKVRLWCQALQMESDLMRNVDRTLLFENFFYRAQSQT